jgi:putative ABC transport system permease protein
VRLGVLATVHEAATGVSRHLARTLLCALGTTVAVVAFVVTNGLSQSANNSVLSSFNALEATTVEFQGGTSQDPLLTTAGVRRLLGVHGVTAAGLVWQLSEQEPYTVLREPDQPPQTGATLSITAVSASAFKAIGVSIQSGRAYDYGADRYHQMVAMLGYEAAQTLGISSTRGSPAIFINGVALTVTGIIGSAQQDAEVLADVVVPPYVASVLSAGTDERTVVATTSPGAAQLVGTEGPSALNPYDPNSITATVPPSPSTLRAQVAESLADLLRLLELAGIVVGVISIAAIMMLAVNQRQTEIGLLRALGYRRLDVARLISLEAMAIGLIGGVIGTAIGMILFVVAADSQHWTPVIPPDIIAIAPLLGLATGALAGTMPALLATRITPIAALRS